jgi:anaerobic selenocysteine-containing dehydrogenase
MSLTSIIETQIKRRTFLKVVGATGAVAALGVGCGPKDDAAPVIPDYELETGKWVSTGCEGCTSWCAKQVLVEEGRAIKTRPNALSKVHGDSGCPREHLGLQQVYDPDRIKVPMKRTNPQKGRDEDPGFIPISWDEAMETFADKLMELQESNETHKFLLMRGRYTQLNQILYDRFPKIMGSPNNISHSSICAEAEKFGPYYTEGYWNYRDYDLDNTKMVILWGADPISSNRQVSYYLKAWGDLLDRAYVVTIDPRLSSSAGKSHDWLPVKPGEDGALALGMAHAILTEGLWSREFVGDFKDGQNRFETGKSVNEDDFEENYTYGLVAWWNLELKDRSPQWAAEKTGIAAEKITAVAKRFGELGPHAIVWQGGGPCMQVRGGYTGICIQALNGLVGSVDNIGGSIRGASVPGNSVPAPDDFMNEKAQAGTKFAKIDQRGTKEFPALNGGRSGGGVVTNRVADAILTENPYDIKLAFGYWNNFNFSCPEAGRWNEAMAKVPFFIHCGTHATEMSMFADILLPSTHHMFEQWGYMSQKGNTYTHAWLNQPVIDPVWDCKDPESEMVWLLAQKLAERGFTNLLEFCNAINDPETGAAAANEKQFALYATKLRTQPLWDPAEYKSGDMLNGWEDFKEKGVWNSGEYPFKKLWGNFGTSTGQFEFYSETLKKALGAHADKHNTTIDDILRTCKYQARGELAFVGHYEEPFVWGDASEYPLVLVDHKSRLNREGRSANSSWYYEMKDVDPGDEKWDDVARINPIDASSLGIANGDNIRLVSPIGSLECKAKLWEGTPPGTIGKTYGQGHWAYGRLAARDFAGRVARGGNNNDILPADYERLSGSTAFYAVTRVRVEKA